MRIKVGRWFWILLVPNLLGLTWATLAAYDWFTLLSKPRRLTLSHTVISVSDSFSLVPSTVEGVITVLPASELVPADTNALHFFDRVLRSEWSYQRMAKLCEGRITCRFFADSSPSAFFECISRRAAKSKRGPKTHLIVCKAGDWPVEASYAGPEDGWERWRPLIRATFSQLYAPASKP